MRKDRKGTDKTDRKTVKKTAISDMTVEERTDRYSLVLNRHMSQL